MANENKMILNRVSSDFTLPQVKTHVNSKKSLPQIKEYLHDNFKPLYDLVNDQ